MEMAEQMIDKLKMLPVAEIERIRAAIDELLDDRKRTLTEDEVEQKLVARGVIAPVTPPDKAYDFHAYQPIEVKGEPLSETIIRERR